VVFSFEAKSKILLVSEKECNWCNNNFPDNGCTPSRLTPDSQGLFYLGWSFFMMMSSDKKQPEHGHYTKKKINLNIFFLTICF
jgi:hypothetical protein